MLRNKPAGWHSRREDPMQVHVPFTSTPWLHNIRFNTNAKLQIPPITGRDAHPLPWIVTLDLSLWLESEKIWSSLYRLTENSLSKPERLLVLVSRKLHLHGWPIYRQSSARVGWPVPMLISEIIHYSEVWTQTPLWLINEHGSRRQCSTSKNSLE